MENLKENPNSHLTAKERDTLSFPAKILLNKNLLNGEVLDFGCGYGSDVKLLKAKGINIEGYDKYHFPNYPSKKFDTIICFYVLNVLLQEEQATVLMELSQLVKPTGKVYIAVRRDLQFEGFRTHKIHRKKTYQCSVLLNSKSFFKNDFCEIYEYQHFTQIFKASNRNCQLCNPSSDMELIVESATAYALFDKFSANEGEAIIIPKRYCLNYFELSFKEQSACVFMLNQVKKILTLKFNPSGFTVKIDVIEKNDIEKKHTHIRLVPTYN
jgi:diadenosine tetraphosphate (Ap4A) HIT family hydrolase